MKKLVTTLSSLLIILGLKAQTPVTIKKETAPRTTSPKVLDSATLKSVKGTTIKDPQSIKQGINDSLTLKQNSIKHEGIKQPGIKHEGIKGATIKTQPTIKDAHIKH